MFLVMLGCGPPQTLLDSLDPAAQPLLQEAPDSATVLLGLDLIALADTEPGQRWAQKHRADLSTLDGRFQERFGVAPTGLERAALSCDEAGCAWLFEGDMSGLQLPAVGGELAHASVPVQDVRHLPGRDALLFRAADGTPLRLQRLDDRRVALGHGPAVKERGAGVTGLEGAIPDGQAWLALRHPEQLLEQVQSYLAWRGTPEALQSAERVERAWSLRPELLDRVQIVALSVSVDQRLAVRVSCWDVEGADAVFGFVEPLLQAQRVEVSLDPTVRDALGHLELVREGRRIELRTDRGFDALEFLFSLAETLP
jgi:hypothetical protein